MKSIRTYGYRKLFLVGMLLVLVITGLRIAWLQTPWGASRKFAGRKTHFELAKRQYQPKWEPVYEEQSTEWSATLLTEEPLLIGTPDEWSGRQSIVVITDYVRGFLGRILMSYALTVKCKTVDNPRSYSISLICHGRFEDGCGVHASYEWQIEGHVLTIHLVETVHRVSRKATFRFRIDRGSMVARVDGEEWATGFPH